MSLISHRSVYFTYRADNLNDISKSSLKMKIRLMKICLRSLIQNGFRKTCRERPHSLPLTAAYIISRMKDFCLSWQQQAALACNQWKMPPRQTSIFLQWAFVQNNPSQLLPFLSKRIPLLCCPDLPMLCHNLFVYEKLQFFCYSQINSLLLVELLTV